jgi:hypothetical protein
MFQTGPVRPAEPFPSLSRTAADALNGVLALLRTEIPFLGVRLGYILATLLVGATVTLAVLIPIAMRRYPTSRRVVITRVYLTIAGVYWTLISTSIWYAHATRNYVAGYTEALLVIVKLLVRQDWVVNVVFHFVIHLVLFIVHFMFIYPFIMAGLTPPFGCRVDTLGAKTKMCILDCAIQALSRATLPVLDNLDAILPTPPWAAERPGMWSMYRPARCIGHALFNVWPASILTQRYGTGQFDVYVLTTHELTSGPRTARNS